MRSPRRLFLGMLILIAAWPSPRTTPGTGPETGTESARGARAAATEARSGGPIGDDRGAEVLRFSSAARQFRFAKDCKLDLLGLEGAALESARQRAIQAYGAVLEHFPEDRAIGAEAAFRAGELARAGGDRGAAEASFREAWGRGLDTPFRGRAAIALGRLAYQDNPEAALGHFERALLDTRTARDLRDEAMLWYARTQGKLGRGADARRLLERVARTALDPIDRVHAFDRIAESWIEAKDLEAAAGVLNDCRRAHSDLLKEESKSGARLRDAVEGMRSFEKLRAAVKARWGTRSDDKARRKVRRR